MIKSILIFVLTLGTALLPAVAQTLTLHDCIQRGLNNKLLTAHGAQRG